MTVPAPIYAGIDPGLSGAIAFVSADGLVASTVFQLVDGPSIGLRELDTAWLSAILEEYNPRLVCLEQVQGFGWASSSFKLGQTYGGIICTTLSGRFRLERVRPQTWQREVFKTNTLDGRDTKALSISYCRARWPGISLGEKRKGGKANHNLADALCLAEYARLRHGHE